MGLLDRYRTMCEGCRTPGAPGIRYDRIRRRWLCRDCWGQMLPPEGSRKHPEDRPEWQMQIRRRLR